MLFGEHSERNPGLVGLYVGALGPLESLQRIRLGISLPDNGCEHVLCKSSHICLQLLLLWGKREINRHCFLLHLMVWIQISIVYKLSLLYPTGDALHSVSPHHVEKGISSRDTRARQTKNRHTT